MTFGRYTLTATVTVPAGVPSAQADAPPVTTTAAQTAPSALTTITSQALAAGVYLLSWTVQLGTAAAAADVNNFGLYSPTGTQVAVSANTGTLAAFPQVPVVFTIPSGGATVYVKNIGNATATSVYTAWLTVTPLGSVEPGRGATVAWSGTGANPVAWAEPFAVTFLPGTPLWLDTAGPLYAAIGAGSLTAFRDGTDAVGHAALSN